MGQLPQPPRWADNVRRAKFSMPIQIRETGSRWEVERDLRAFEVRYGMSSAEFLNCAEGSVPEFDAIEWNFLLMQKDAFEQDNCKTKRFSAQSETRTSVVDTCEWRGDVAA